MRGKRAFDRGVGDLREPQPLGSRTSIRPGRRRQAATTMSRRLVAPRKNWCGSTSSRRCRRGAGATYGAEHLDRCAPGRPSAASSRRRPPTNRSGSPSTSWAKAGSSGSMRGTKSAGASVASGGPWAIASRAEGPRFTGLCR